MIIYVRVCDFLIDQTNIITIRSFPTHAYTPHAAVNLLGEPMRLTNQISTIIISAASTK